MSEARNNDGESASSIKSAAERQFKAVSADADPKTVDEEQFSARLSETQLHGMQQNIKERKKYALRIFILNCCWVSAVFLLLILQGLGSWWWLRFNLSQPVLLAAIGSTTVNVIGLFYIVAHYLFPDLHNSKLAAKKIKEESN